MWGFFGWHTVPSTSDGIGGGSGGGDSNGACAERRIILTEGEYDAMAVSQALATLPPDDPLAAVPAVSLPNGCNSLPPELVQLLEPFDRIFLWLDNDQSGQSSCEKFVDALGARRCLIVRPPAGDKVRLTSVDCQSCDVNIE